MTARLEDLLGEEWPDGTFGGPRPDGSVRYPIDPALAAAHREQLLAALAEHRQEARDA